MQYCSLLLCLSPSCYSAEYDSPLCIYLGQRGALNRRRGCSIKDVDVLLRWGNIPTRILLTKPKNSTPSLRKTKFLSFPKQDETNYLVKTHFVSARRKQKHKAPHRLWLGFSQSLQRQAAAAAAATATATNCSSHCGGGLNRWRQPVVTVTPSNRLQLYVFSSLFCFSTFLSLPISCHAWRHRPPQINYKSPRPTGPRRSWALIQRLAWFPRSFGGPGQLDPAAHCVLPFDPRSRWCQNSDNSLFGGRWPVFLSAWCQRVSPPSPEVCVCVTQ